jgi:L-ascorbate metabolism protein UlaG (beta-lactamase superfamily)
VVEAGQRRVFFAGDTGYSSHFHEIRDRCGPIDIALLPIGAYEPRWFMKDIHMDSAEAVQAHLDLRALLSIGMHHGTFQLTAEGIDEPLLALREALRMAGVPPSRFRAVGAGESLTLEEGEEAWKT